MLLCAALLCLDTMQLIQLHTYRELFDKIAKFLEPLLRQIFPRTTEM
jgi:hypothetical protein